MCQIEQKLGVGEIKPAKKNKKFKNENKQIKINK
jgi:hypothetical protein